jgi:hypothetical protein
MAILLNVMRVAIHSTNVNSRIGLGPITRHSLQSSVGLIISKLCHWFGYLGLMWYTRQQNTIFIKQTKEVIA